MGGGRWASFWKAARSVWILANKAGSTFSIAV